MLNVKVAQRENKYVNTHWLAFLLQLLYNRLHYDLLPCSGASIAYLEITFDTLMVKEHQTVVIYLTKDLVFFLFYQSLN